MLEFFTKNLVFFIVVTIVGSFVIWSVKKDREKEEKKQKDGENDKKGK